jgi:hypothetical protein
MSVGKNQHSEEVQVGKEPRTRMIRFELLRTHGRDALDIAGLEGIKAVSFREVEIAFGDTFQRIIILRAADLFGREAGRGADCRFIPHRGRIIRAVFALLFQDCLKPIKLELRAPNVVIFPQDNHAGLVNRWLARAQIFDPPNQ